MSDDGPKRKPDKADAGAPPPKRVRRNLSSLSDEQLLRTLKVAIQRFSEARTGHDEPEDGECGAWGQLLPQKAGARTLEVTGATFFLGVKNNSLASSSGSTSVAREKLVAKFIKGAIPSVESLSSTAELYVNQRLISKGTSTPLRSGDELHISSSHRFHSYIFSLLSSVSPGNTSGCSAPQQPIAPPTPPGNPIAPPAVSSTCSLPLANQTLKEDTTTLEEVMRSATPPPAMTLEDETAMSDIVEEDLATGMDCTSTSADQPSSNEAEVCGSPPHTAAVGAQDSNDASPVPASALPSSIAIPSSPPSMSQVSEGPVPCPGTPACALHDSASAPTAPVAISSCVSPSPTPGLPLTNQLSSPCGTPTRLPLTDDPQPVPPNCTSCPPPDLFTIPSSSLPLPLPPLHFQMVSCAVQTDALPNGVDIASSSTKPFALPALQSSSPPLLPGNVQGPTISTPERAIPLTATSDTGGRSVSGRPQSSPVVVSEVHVPIPPSSSSSSSAPLASPEGTSSAPPHPVPMLTAPMTTAITVSHLKEKLIRELSAQVLKAEDIPTSLNSPADFPYYLAETTRQQLLHAVYLPLMKPAFLRFSPSAASHPNLSRNVCLAGPPGTEVYQEVLARSLARTFGAFFLAVDRLVPQSSRPPSGAPQARPSRQLQRGSRVIYAPCSFGVTAAPTLGQRLHGILSSGTIGSPVAPQGPPIGARGRVVLAFEDNPQRPKVGVAFDQPVPGGCDLGGLCPPDHGFFAAVTDVMPEQEEQVSGQTIAIQALFEVVALHQPCVVFLRDVESVCFGNAERFLAFRKLTEQATTPAVFLARSIKQETQRPLPKVSVTVRGCNAADSFLPPLPFEPLNLPDLPAWLLGGCSGSSGSYDEMPFPVKGLGIKRTTEGIQPRVLQKLFPTTVALTPLPDEMEQCASTDIKQWKDRLSQDSASITILAGAKALRKAMEESNVSCPELFETLAHCRCNDPENVLARFKALGLSELLQKTALGPQGGKQGMHCATGKQVVQWAVAHQLQTHPAVMFTPTDRRLVLQSSSLIHALQLLVKTDKALKMPNKVKELMQTSNEFEKRLLSEVVQPSQINVTFDQIGSHEKVKQLLREVVLLPLTRPSLFNHSRLLRPCKGILLFGPPGTGKTMLAKAIATEAKAHFINITMGVVTSKWFGEAEKLVAAVFSLARRLAPCIVFIDEVDAMLGRRSSDQEHETMRKLKNEFMAAWDGLKSQEYEQVIVLAATNRPGDLDDAVLRRMPRRILVDVPDQENRRKILEVILKGEKLGADVDLDEVAKITSGYSGSDLKQLCVAAAYRPVREYLQSEEGRTSLQTPEQQDEADQATELRSIGLNDFKEAAKEVGGSVHEEALSITELRKWNAAFGDGGSRDMRDQLTYFM